MEKFLATAIMLLYLALPQLRCVLPAQPLCASAGLSNLNLTIDGTAYVIAMDSAGAITPSPALPTGVSIVSTVTGSADGKVVIEYDPQLTALCLTNHKMH